jgi:hypothetical protein
VTDWRCCLSRVGPRDLARAPDEEIARQLKVVEAKQPEACRAYCFQVHLAVGDGIKRTKTLESQVRMHFLALAETLTPGAEVRLGDPQTVFAMSLTSSRRRPMSTMLAGSFSSTSLAIPPVVVSWARWPLGCRRAVHRHLAGLVVGLVEGAPVEVRQCSRERDAGVRGLACGGCGHVNRLVT